MNNFAYARAGSVDAAVAAAANGASIVAGGTELLNWLRLGIAAPAKVIDIGNVDDLRRIVAAGTHLEIGALATLNEIGESAAVRSAARVLADACLKAASAQLRNRATLGGNILQKTRCPYFRAEAPGATPMPWPCNKRMSGSGCAAKESGHPRLALFGWTDACVATQPSDPAVALAALDAAVEVRGPDGVRTIPMREFHVTQEEAAQMNGGDGARVENRLRPADVVIGFHVPIDDASRRSAYVKMRERESYEYALVSAAAAVDIEAGRIRSARIALGSVAQKPWRLVEAEAALQGQSLDDATIDKALDLALVAARPLPGNEFKLKLARNTARRALLIAGGRT